MGGSLEYKEIVDMNKKHGQSEHNSLPTFVETGTYKAVTTLTMAKEFKNVFTTEIHEGLYKAAAAKFKQLGVKNVYPLHGDSLELLPYIALQTKEGAVFFLDAHISGGDSSWNNKDRVPLLAELEIILRTKPKASLFILDDLRFWKGESRAAWDWANISVNSVLALFAKHGIDVHDSTKYNDRFWVWTK